MPDEGDELEEAAAEAAGALDSAEGHGGADDGGAAAAKKHKKGIKFGKVDCRWAARCSRGTIGADLARAAAAGRAARTGSRLLWLYKNVASSRARMGRIGDTC